MILVPIAHYPTFGKIPDELRANIVAEAEKYQSALRRMYNAYGQELVSFQISRESARGMSHAHIQILPIPKDKVSALAETIREEAKKENMIMLDQAPVSEWSWGPSSRSMARNHTCNVGGPEYQLFQNGFA